MCVHCSCTVDTILHKTDVIIFPLTLNTIITNRPNWWHPITIGFTVMQLAVQMLILDWMNGLAASWSCQKHTRHKIQDWINHHSNQSSIFYFQPESSPVNQTLHTFTLREFITNNQRVCFHDRLMWHQKQLWQTHPSLFMKNAPNVTDWAVVNNDIREERSGMESYPVTQWRKASDILTSTPYRDY